MKQTLSSEELDQANLNLAKESRQLLGIPITFHPQGHQDEPSSSRSSPTLWPPILANPPTALEFSRIISKHSPVIIKNCFGTDDDVFKFRPGLKKWKANQYLEQKLKGKFKVTVTEDGKADDLKVIKDPNGGQKLVFALPYEEELPMSTILTNICNPSKASDPRQIYYVQSQNNNLKSDEAGDFSPLLQDLQVKTKDRDSKKEVRSDLVWASDALGIQPEANNVWIGSQRSMSSTHRDHYENLFTVIRGRKLFTVFPPTEAHFLCDDDLYPVYQSEPQAIDSSQSLSTPSTSTSSSPSNPGSSSKSNSSSKSVFTHRPLSTPAIPWIPIDPTEPPDSKRNRPYQTYAKGLAPLKIWVEEGETLFLPSGWFHHVSQESNPRLQRKKKDDDEGGNGENRNGETYPELEMEEIGICLSVNWWYESENGFGDRWAWSGFAREIRRRLNGRWGEMEEEREKDEEHLMS